jgi:hypothetical protein
LNFLSLSTECPEPWKAPDVHNLDAIIIIRNRFIIEPLNPMINQPPRPLLLPCDKSAGFFNDPAQFPALLVFRWRDPVALPRINNHHEMFSHMSSSRSRSDGPLQGGKRL